MTTPAIFNDQLFESPEAQLEFQERTAHMDPAYVEKLRSVLGKPSQFVSRVTNYETAVQHWALLEEWERTEGAEWERKRKEVEQFNSGAVRRGPGRPRKEHSVMPAIPKPPAERRGPGRPSLREGISEEDKKVIREALNAWKVEKTKLEDFAKECKKWKLNQLRLMDEQIDQQVNARLQRVDELRAIYERLRDGTG